MAAFSTPSEHAFENVPGIAPECFSDAHDANGDALNSFNTVYEVDRTIAQITNHGYRRVALQFPDSLLSDAVDVYKSLRSALPLSTELYVLADTTYGSCCVDEVAAQHVDADCLVHYGHACLSPTSRLPVIYVFRKRSIRPSHCAEQIKKTLEEFYSSQELQNHTPVASTSKAESTNKPLSILVKFDVSYTWKAENVLDSLKKSLPPSTKLYHSKFVQNVNHTSSNKEITSNEPTTTSVQDTPNGGCWNTSTTSCDCSVISTSSRKPTSPAKSPSQTSDPSEEVSPDIICFIGGESLALTNLLMTRAPTPIISYDPAKEASKIESGKTNQLLGRRYAVVQKVRDADVIGLVVGTLGVSSYLTLLNHLRKILRERQKKVYTLAVGKLNPEKLANYQEIEAFVLVACPENSLVEDPKVYYRPIITPFELEVALGYREWTGEWHTEFNQILATAPERTTSNVDNSSSDDDEPVFSTVTGTYRTPKKYVGRDSRVAGDNDSEALSNKVEDLSLLNSDREVAVALGSAAGEHLSGRTYRGLDPRRGMDAPAQLEQGRKGIARGYSSEK